MADEELATTIACGLLFLAVILAAWWQGLGLARVSIFILSVVSLGGALTILQWISADLA